MLCTSFRISKYFILMLKTVKNYTFHEVYISHDNVLQVFVLKVQIMV